MVRPWSNFHYCAYEYTNTIEKNDKRDRFEVIEIALKDLDRVSDVIWTMQTKEIPKLIQRAQEWEFPNWWVKTLEMNKGVKGSGIVHPHKSESDLKWLRAPKDN